MKKISFQLNNIYRCCQKKGPVSYKGDYHDWQLAASICEGYDSDKIFEKACESALKVKNKEACFDRDTVLFYEKKANYPLVMWMTIMANHVGDFNVVDLGGAMGSTYYQNYEYLKKSGLNLTWYVKEQDHFVTFGQKELESDTLHFIDDFHLVSQKKNVLLCSSVLQYIEEWEELLVQAITILNPQYIIFERTPVGNRERIWIETVKEPIYEASYPCRVFDEEDLCDKMCNIFRYKILDTWKSLVDCDLWGWEGIIAEFKSFVFRQDTDI